MNRKLRAILLMLCIVLVVLIGFLTLYCEVQQKKKDQALIAAVKARDNKRILSMLAEGADGEARDRGKPPTYRAALLQLAYRFQYHRFQYPCANPSGVSPQTGQDTDRSPALLLCYHGASVCWPTPLPDLAVIRALLDHGAQVNDRDADGTNVLFYASEFSASDIVRFLLARGADMEAKDTEGDTALVWASAENAKILLEHGANIEARNKHQITPLFEAVINQNVDKVRILLEHGADANASDLRKTTPLIWAVYLNRISKVRLLLQHGAKVTSTAISGQSAFEWAKRRSDPDARKIVALLRQYSGR